MKPKETQSSSSKPEIGRKILLRRLGICAGITLTMAALLVGLLACNKNKPGDTSTTDTTNNLPPATVPAGDYHSPSGISMSEDGAYAYVSDETACAVYKISTADGSVAASYVSELAVHNAVVSGDRVYVTEGALGGKLVVLDTNLSVQGSVVTGHTPYDVVVVGNTAYVANRFSNSVSVVDLGSMTETKEISVTREPESMALAGTDLLVACHLPEDAANSDVVSANVDVIDTASNTVTKSISLVNGAGSVKDIVATSDGKTAYVSHIIAHYQYPTTQLDGGWINTNGISVIDVASGTVKYTYLLDDLEHGAGNPWGLALSDDNAYLYCAISGTGELIRTNLSKLATLASRAGKTGSAVSSTDEIVNCIPFAAAVKERIELGGIGARSVAYANGNVYVAEYFSGDVKVVDGKNMTVSSTLAIGTQPEADDVRLGEIYWYDATVCYQEWQSCASCHPDARADGFNWDNLNDGLGTSKQAKSMIYSHRTPPVMVTGIRPDAETAVAAGFKYICFNANTSGVIDKIDAYLKTLQPEQSPYLNDDGTLTEAAQKGKELFAQYNCATCHPAPLYTDMQKHLSIDLEGDASWEYREMDTPSLVEIWRTAPWGYYGGHTDMVEYVKYSVSKQGLTISDEDAAALAEYVLSIGAEGETYGAEQIANSNSTYNKLVPGTTISALTVRQQAKDAPNATVTLTLYDAGGKEIATASGSITAGDYNTVFNVTLDKEISVPENIGEGAYYVVSIKDASGNSLATDLKITN
ncbi:MAG: c-type cytochrome [Eubacteriales bacterium]